MTHLSCQANAVPPRAPPAGCGPDWACLPGPGQSGSHRLAQAWPWGGHGVLTHLGTKGTWEVLQEGGCPGSCLLPCSASQGPEEAAHLPFSSRGLGGSAHRPYAAHAPSSWIFRESGATGEPVSWHELPPWSTQSSCDRLVFPPCSTRQPYKGTHKPQSPGVSRGRMFISERGSNGGTWGMV